MRNSATSWRYFALLLAALGGCREATPDAYAPNNSATAASTVSSTGAMEPASSAEHPVSALAKTDSWPQFLGPQRNGVAADREWSSDLSDGVALAWKTNVGTGYSSIAVANNKAYTMGYRDGRDVVYCFNAETGEELWKADYECSLVDSLHEGGPGATPTIDGDRVYTFSRDGHFHCFNAETGEIHWLVMTPKVTGVKRPEWGFTSSPLVLDDLVIVDAGAVLAVNKNSGEIVWQSEKYRPGYGSAVVFQPKEETLIAVLNNEVLLVVKASDGATVAETKWETSFRTNGATPLVLGDTLFVSTGYRRGCSRFKFTGDSLESLYETKAVSSHMANCVPVGEYLYGIDGNSHSSRNCKLVCVEAATGKQLWEERGCGAGTVLAAGDVLLVLTDDGRLQTVKASPAGYEQITQRSVLEDTCWTPPALAGRRVYCRNDSGDLVCVTLPPN